MAKVSPPNQKLAEKLTILNNHVVGIMTRIYYIKKACSDNRSKNNILNEKNLEGAIKFISKRFPNVDIRSHQNQLAAVNNMKNDILKGLSVYYHTFIDVMEIKDQFFNLMGVLNSSGIYFDITVNYDLTTKFLTLFTNFASLMMLLRRIEDRKAILSLYAHAHEMLNSKQEKDYPRIAQIIQDYEDPIKKLCEDITPYSRTIHSAVLSLIQVYSQRNKTADVWRSAYLFNLTAAPAQMLNPAQSEKLQCEYISLESLEKWIYFGYLFSHSFMTTSHDATNDLWKPVLQGNFCLTLFRDEVIMLHKTAEELFSTIKGYNKKIAEIKESRDLAVQNAANNHRNKRNYLRMAMKDLVVILSDQPGLFGPKILYVFMALSYARDEVHWVIRHSKNLIKKSNIEDFQDKNIAELFFYMEELRHLVRRYDEVIQRYYVQYMYGYDSVVLNEAVQNLTVCPEDESVILTSIVNTLSQLSIKQVENKEIFDFRAMRLDWFRFQAYSSVGKAPLSLKDNSSLARLLNMIVFHSKCVDELDELLNETSDLSNLCFYHQNFAQAFERCLDNMQQSAFSISFPMICSHFVNCVSDFCPEERSVLRERTLTLVNNFLEGLAKKTKKVLFSIASEQSLLYEQLAPKKAAILVNQNALKRIKKNKNQKFNLPEIARPGAESMRKDRLQVSKLDHFHFTLAELCNSINHRPTVKVWDHVFAPKEYLITQIENQFSRSLIQMAQPKDPPEITQPSVLLYKIKSYMTVLQSLENYIHLDVSSIFSSILLQHSQMLDSRGETTITTLYTQWYLEVMLRNVTNGNNVFSEIRGHFVKTGPLNDSNSQNQLLVNPEEYSNITELRALAQIIGPYGMKFLNESLIWHISSQITELKKLVSQNSDALTALRMNFDKPEQMSAQYRKLENAESVLLRMTIIGVILSFRDICQQALNDVLQRRVPFLLASIADFKEHIPKETDIKVAISVNELASAAGFACDVDPTLCSALATHKVENHEEEYRMSCLLMVFLAVSIPLLARDEKSFFTTQLVAHGNNCHTLARAINHVAAALFTVHGGNVEDRLKEFLALASSSLLKLGQESDRASTRNRESIYLLLEQIVRFSPFLTMDLLESCFPYVLLRNSYHAVTRLQANQASTIRRTESIGGSSTTSAN